MGNKPSNPIVEHQTDQVFNNLVILRQLLGMLPSQDIRNLRRVNKAVNQMGCNFLQGRLNKVRPISTGTELWSFLDRMGKRLEPQPCFSSFNLSVCGIPLPGILRFCTEMTRYVRELKIDLGKIPLFWYLLTNLNVGYDSWNDGRVKTIQLLESFSNVEQLQLAYDDEDEDNILTEAELQRLPASFPRLRLFRCTHLDDYYILTPPLQRALRTFFVATIQKSPNLEHLVIERSDHDLPFNFRLLPELLTGFPQPPALSIMMPIGLDLEAPIHANWRFISDFTRRGFNNLRSFKCHIYSSDNQALDDLNAFLSLQTQSLTSLALTCEDYEDDDPTRWVLPVFRNVTSLSVKFYRWPITVIPDISVQQFPKLTELKRREYSGFSALLYGDLRITGK